MTEEKKSSTICPLNQSDADCIPSCPWWIEYEGREFGECAVVSIASHLRQLFLRGIDVTNHF